MRPEGRIGIGTLIPNLRRHLIVGQEDVFPGVHGVGESGSVQKIPQLDGKMTFSHNVNFVRVKRHDGDQGIGAHGIFGLEQLREDKMGQGKVNT